MSALRAFSRAMQFAFPGTSPQATGVAALRAWQQSTSQRINESTSQRVNEPRTFPYLFPRMITRLFDIVAARVERAPQSPASDLSRGIGVNGVYDTLSVLTVLEMIISCRCGLMLSPPVKGQALDVARMAAWCCKVILCVVEQRQRS